MGRRTERGNTDGQQRGHTDGQQVHVKIFIITHQGNENENHNEISPHTCQEWLLSKRQ